MSKPQSAQSVATPSIYLEYGADAAECDEESFEICERGMRLHTRWRLREGTQYSVSFACEEPEGGWVRVQTEATVVECQPDGPECHRVTLYFTQMPEKLRAAIRDVSARLEAQVGGATSRRRT